MENGAFAPVVHLVFPDREDSYILDKWFYLSHMPQLRIGEKINIRRKGVGDEGTFLITDITHRLNVLVKHEDDRYFYSDMVITVEAVSEAELLDKDGE